MVRTIYVVYTNQKLSYLQLQGRKQYMFLCPYDVIQAGDMIEDKRYSSPMQVVSWTMCTSQVQNGMTIKAIEPSRLNGAAIYVETEQNTSNMEEKRNVSISLEEAREWYKSGNNVLKAIALKAYSEQEFIILRKH